jgi:Kef-type K+ transport system membrane component KefB
MKKSQDIFIFLGTIIALIGLMVLKQFVTPAGAIAEQVGNGGFDPNAIAATGFIILAAFTMGELFKQLKMPALLGYIAAGIVFGPDLSKIIFDTTDRAIFSSDVIDRLALINTLTVGVIGTLGGGELKISELKDQAGTILWVIGMSFLAIVPASGAVVFGLSYVLPDIVPFLADVPQTTKLAVSMLFWVFGFAMSPAATLAIIQETRAKGRFTSLTLGVVIVADLVLVASFLLTFNFAKLLTRPEGFSAQALVESLPAIGAEFGWAIVIGIVMGLVFIAYLRFVAREKLLFTVGVIFAGAAVAKMLHAEMLLAFLVAGFIVQNLSRHGHDMIHALEKISLPVFVVYFMIQAAQLDLVSLVQFMPLAIILTIVRTAGLYGGVKLATRVVKAPDHIDSNLWMAFFSRGGVDIVLATLVANQIDAWGTEFKAVIMATVVIHIIGGPAILKWVFERVGETEEARQQGSEEVAELDRMLHGDHATTDAPFDRPEFGHEELNARLDEIVASLENCYNRCIVQQLDQRHQYLEQAVERISIVRERAVEDLVELLEDADEPPKSLSKQVKRIHVRFRQSLQPQVEILEQLEPMAITPETTDDLLSNVRSFVDFDEHYKVEWEPRLLEPSDDDGQLLKAVKVFRRVREKVAGLGTRSVSLGRLWRYYMELSLPGYLASAVSATADRNERFWYEFGGHLRRVDDLFETTVEILREEHAQDDAAPDASDASTDEIIAADGRMSPTVNALPMSLSPGSEDEDEHADDHGHGEHHEEPHEHEQDAVDDEDRASSDADERAASGDGPRSPLDEAREWVQTASQELHDGGENLNSLLIQFVQTSRDRFTFAVQRAYADFIEGVQTAGTVELPSFRYRPSGRYDDALRAEERLHHRLGRESDIVAGYQGWISLDQQLVLFLHWFRSYQLRVTSVLDNRFQQGALQTLRRFLSRCDERPSALRDSAGEDDVSRIDWPTWYHEQIQPALDAARSSLDNALTGFSQGIVTRRLMDVLEARVARFSDSIRLLVQNPVESVEGGADVETVDLPLRAWYFSKLVREAALGLVEFNERAERIVRRALVGLGEVEQVLEERLVSEQAEDGAELDVANQLADKGLREAQGELKTIIEKVREDEHELRVWVVAETTQVVQDSTAPFLEHRLLEVMRDLSRARGETLAQRSVEPIISRLKGAYRTIAPLYEELASDLQQRLSQETESPTRNEVRERLVERDGHKSARTPAIYRRLF